MKIIVISDLHGNFPALKAVLEDIPNNDGIVCCGDIVGYYPDVNEVCDEIRKLDVIAIRGNHDAYVTKFLEPDPSKIALYKTEWTRRTLTRQNYRWLRSLPVELNFDFNETLIKIRHANFIDERMYLYPDSIEIDKVDLRENELVLLGHTHHPMKMRAGKGMIVNPGSVGQPRDWNPCASYAIIDTHENRVEFRRVEYAVSEFQSRLRELNWNQLTIDILSRRKDI